MLVTITTSLLMIKAQSMKKLMLDYVMVNTAIALQGNNLSSTSATHERVAPVQQRITSQDCFHYLRAA